MKAFGRFADAFFAEKGSQYNQNIYVNFKKNAPYQINTKWQIFSTNILLISQRHWTYQNGNNRKDHLPKSRYFLDKDRYFSSHPSVIQKKEKTIKYVCNFIHVLPRETYRAIFNVNQIKSTSATIPTTVLHSLAKEIWSPLTEYINSAILTVKFPSELKIGGVIPVIKKATLLKRKIIGESVYFLHYRKSTISLFTNN